MRKKTHGEFVKEVYDLVGDEYTVLGQYNGANNHVLTRHNKCGFEWGIQPSNFLYGKRCPQCAGVLKYTLEKAIKKYADLDFELLAAEYKDVLTPMPFICYKHKDKGIQYSPLTSINQGFGCHYCRYEKSGLSQQIDRDTIINEFKDVGLILQSDFTYNKIHDPLPCVCEKHPNLGIQYISLNNVRYNKQQGCQRCGYERMGQDKRMHDDEIRELVKSLDLEYVSTIKERKTKVEYICPKHREMGIQIKMLQKLKLGQGCKYCKASHGERRIEKFFRTIGISFEPQKQFDGLLGLGGNNLSYDFFVEDNLLIEFQGEQHERYIKGFHKNKQSFEKQKEHDRRKRNFANSSGIELLEIWYYEFDNIEKILLKSLADIKPVGDFSIGQKVVRYA